MGASHWVRTGGAAMWNFLFPSPSVFKFGAPSTNPGQAGEAGGAAVIDILFGRALPMDSVANFRDPSEGAVVIGDTTVDGDWIVAAYNGADLDVSPQALSRVIAYPAVVQNQFSANTDPAGFTGDYSGTGGPGAGAPRKVVASGDDVALLNRVLKIPGSSETGYIYRTPDGSGGFPFSASSYTLRAMIGFSDLVAGIDGAITASMFGFVVRLAGADDPDDHFMVAVAPRCYSGPSTLDLDTAFLLQFSKATGLWELVASIDNSGGTPVTGLDDTSVVEMTVELDGNDLSVSLSVLDGTGAGQTDTFSGPSFNGVLSPIPNGGVGFGVLEDVTDTAIWVGGVIPSDIAAASPTTSNALVTEVDAFVVQEVA